MDRELAQRLNATLGRLLGTLEELQGLLAEVTEQLASTSVRAPAKAKPLSAETKLGLTALGSAALDSAPITEGPYGEFTKSERKVMVALAQIGKPVPTSVVGLVARISHKTGPFGTTLAELRRAGYVTGTVANLAITPEGLEALGDFAPLPRGHELFEYWCNKLPGSCGKILRALKTATHPIASDEVGRIAGISSTTGPFGTALATLRKLDFVTGTGKDLALSEDVRKLFEPTIGVHEPSTGRSVRVNRSGQVQR